VPDECECGDVNNDGHLDTRDLVFLVFHLFGHTPPGFAIAKCNVSGEPGDGPETCTGSDLVALRRGLARHLGSRREEPRFAPLCQPPRPVVASSDVCVDAPPPL
jgi:hypothetical protein